MRRLLPLLTLLLIVMVAFWLTWGVGWPVLARYQAALAGWVEAHPLLAGLTFMLVYTASVALSLPHGALLTAAGGLLFGPVRASLMVAVAASAGGVLLILLLRSVLPETLARQRQRIPESMRMRLQRDGLSYLLFARLLPVFPFWLVNLAAAVAGLKLPVFILGTCVGVLPVTFAVASIGAGIGDVLAAGQIPDLMVVFAPHILLPLIGLAVLSLLPVLLRRRGQHA